MSSALLCAAAHANVVYSVDIAKNGYFATGTITTNGTFGSLSTSDVVDWEITLQHNQISRTLLGPLSGSNSWLIAETLSDNDVVTATANGLFTNFPARTFTTGWQFRDTDTVLAIENYYVGGGIVVFSAQEYDTHNQIYHSRALAMGDGEQFAVANPVPEPETYAMLLAGLGLLGFMARRRKQQPAA